MIINSEKDHIRIKLFFLLTLRFVVGWYILYEGISKALNSQWTSVDFLQESHGVLSVSSNWILSNNDLIAIIDALNIWSLAIIGLVLIFGFIFRPAAIVGAFLIFIYNLTFPSMVGSEHTIFSEGSNMIVNNTLIEVAALCVLVFFPTCKTFGLDFFYLLA